MIKIKWVITDKIEDISADEFNNEWNGIFGYFEMNINNQVVGFCPDRKMFLDEEANEDILYWLLELSEGIIRLDDSLEYEVQLLSMNRAKLVLKKEDKLRVSFVISNTDEVIWSEAVAIQEWLDEIRSNTSEFIDEIMRVNSVLLNTNLMQKLIKIKDKISIFKFESEDEFLEDIANA